MKRESRFLPVVMEGDSILYATHYFYSFFRHFFCLYERIIKVVHIYNNE